MSDRLRVFVSSRMEELAAERHIIRTILDDMHIDAWIFEKDAGARVTSIQQTFLEEVEKSDIYLGLFWKGYGSYTIEEYEYARKIGKDCLIYEKRANIENRDQKLQTFLESVGQVEKGLTVQWFNTLAELELYVKRAVAYRLAQTYRTTQPLSSQTRTVLYNQPGKISKPEKLIGRKNISAQVNALLKDGRKVLLHGMGGTGKTALAASIADDRISTGKGAVLWLQPNLWDTGEAILNALVYPLTTDEEIQEVINLHGEAKIKKVGELLLQSQASLLILDDLWDGNALRMVMDAVPKKMPALITSRQKFPKFERVEVSDLTPSDAVAVLSHYSGGRDFQMDSDALLLCEELGYHVYALEIAGATLDVDNLEPGELLEQISGEIHTLQMPGDFAEEGRESVKKLLDRSYHALDTEQRSAFRSFGALFAPGATTGLLAEITQLDHKKTDQVLKILVRRSLAQRQPGTDYFYVHALTFSYATMLYQEQEQDPPKLFGAVRHYVEQNGRNFEQLDLDYANILGAAEQSDFETRKEIISILALEGYQDYRGYPPDYLNVFDGVLRYLGTLLDQEQLDDQSIKTYRNLLGKRGNAYFHCGEHKEAAKVYQSAIDLSDEDDVILKLSGLVGRVLSFDNQPQEAQAYFERGYHLAEQMGRDDLYCWVLQQESYAAGHAQDYKRVVMISKKQFDVYENILLVEDSPEIKTQLFYALLNWGSAKLDLAIRDLPDNKRIPVIKEANEIHERAQEIAGELNNEIMRAEVNLAIGEEYHYLGSHLMAHEYFLKALETWEEKGITQKAEKTKNLMRKYGYTL